MASHQYLYFYFAQFPSYIEIQVEPTQLEYRREHSRQMLNFDAQAVHVLKNFQHDFFLHLRFESYGFRVSTQEIE